MDQIIIFLIATVCLVIFLVLMIMLLQWSKNIIFRPSSEIVWTPAEGTYNVITHQFEDKHVDGKSFTLRGWYFNQFPNQPTVLFMGDNTGNISYYQDVFEICQRRGYNLILFNYPGYGNSVGHISLKNMYAAAECMYLYTKRITQPENIILWGHSLGAHLVASVCALYDYRQTILTGAFSSIYDTIVTKYRYPFIEYLASYYTWYSGKMDNVDLFKRIQDRYRTNSRTGKIDLVLSTKDEIIPYDSTFGIRQLCDDNIILHTNEMDHNGQISYAFNILPPTSEALIENTNDYYQQTDNDINITKSITPRYSTPNKFTSNKIQVDLKLHN